LRNISGVKKKNGSKSGGGFNSVGNGRSQGASVITSGSKKRRSRSLGNALWVGNGACSTGTKGSDLDESEGGGEREKKGENEEAHFDIAL